MTNYWTGALRARFVFEPVNGLLDPPRRSSVELAQFLLRPGVEQDAIAHRLSFEGPQDFLSGHRFDLALGNLAQSLVSNPGILLIDQFDVLLNEPNRNDRSSARSISAPRDVGDVASERSPIYCVGEFVSRLADRELGKMSSHTPNVPQLRQVRQVGQIDELGGALFAAFFTPADAGLDETVDVAVEDRGRVARLVLGAQVFDHLIRLHDVRADLIAPGGLDVAREFLLLRVLLLLAQQEQPGLQHAQRGGAVLDLRFFILHRHDDAGGDVGHAHRGVGGVHALPAGARGAEHVDLDLRLGDLDVVGLLDEGNHFYRGAGGVAPPLVVER